MVLGYFAGALARYIPFSAEERLAAHFAPKDSVDPPLRQYLQNLANRLAKAEHLPPGMHITVHYINSDTVNAFATLGGHVVFFRGLLERLPDENALAMVMAHEIAHVKTRAPLRSLGRGMVIAIALSLVDTALSTELAGNALGQAGLLTQMKFSRAQESEADRIGQAALASTYGGIAGADELFAVLKTTAHEKGSPVTELYRSHPDIAARLAALHRQARAHGWHKGTITPLPPGFSHWLNAGGKKQTTNPGKESAAGKPGDAREN